MLANGHPDAWSYPIWMLNFESGLIVSRQNADHATAATLIKMALDATPNQSIKASYTKKAAQAFGEQVKKLFGG